MVQPTSLAAEHHDLNEPTDSSRLASWLRASVVDLAPTRRMRLAWMGRTSHDEVQDPTISIPRQLRACHAVLSEDMEITLHFWDVETSRNDLDARGSSTAWKNFDIPIPRDGGIGDLLAQARRPDRRFDGVICESIDRIARLTYQSTKIEYDLEQLGIPLIAADEPVMRSSRTGRIEKRAGMVLLRRAKQGVAEWYVLEMLEKSPPGHRDPHGPGLQRRKAALWLHRREDQAPCAGQAHCREAQDQVDSAPGAGRGGDAHLRPAGQRGDVVPSDRCSAQRGPHGPPAARAP
jgi:hypothetical protein